MDRRLGGVSTVNSVREAFVDTGATHGMGPNYRSFLSYHQFSSGEYATLGNGGGIP